MRLIDCEITHRHVRGQNLVIIFGERALDSDELAALLREYDEAYGPGTIAPAYASPDGWQVHRADADAAGGAAAPDDAADAPAPAPAPAAAPAAKRAKKD